MNGGLSVVAVVVLLAPAVVTRRRWSRHPTFGRCAAHWSVALLSFGLLASSWPFAVLVCGMAMNAVVTLANGGRMPVREMSRPKFNQVWVRARSHHRLLWLSDHDRWFGASLGDAVLLCGSVAHVAVTVWTVFSLKGWL